MYQTYGDRQTNFHLSIPVNGRVTAKTSLEIQHHAPAPKLSTSVYHPVSNPIPHRHS